MQRMLARAVVMLMLVAASQACECGSDGLARRLAELSVSPDPVDFGQVPSGVERRTQVTITATGTAAVFIQGLEVTENPEEFGIELPPSVVFPYQLTPGAKLVFEVTYLPRNWPEDDRGTVQIHSTDSQAEYYDLECTGKAVQPVLQVEPVPVEFPPTRVADTSPATLSVTNTGSSGKPVKISTITLSDDGGGDFSIQQAPSLPVQVPIGESVRVNLAYTPGEIDDADRGTLLLESDAENQQHLEISLLGSSFAPSIEVSPTSLDFGTVQLGQHPSLDFTIGNRGNSDLNILEMSLSQTGSLQYSLDPASIAEPIPPLESRTVTVTYHADHMGTDDGTIIVRHDDPLSPTVFVQLHGRTPSPDIDLQPDNLTIRLAHQSHVQSAEIRIYNVGDAPLNVTGMDFENPDGTFSVTAEPAWPVQVAPGTIPDGPYEAVEVTFEIYQQTAGDTCRLTFHSDDPDEPLVTATVIGTYTP